MNRRQKIIVSVTGIFIVLLALVGLTYAYFVTQIEGNKNNTSISVTTKNLKLTYLNDDGGIIGGDKLFPSNTEYTKTFSVKNEGNANIEYSVYLIDVVNTFELKGDIKYTLTCTTTGTIACNEVETETTFPSGIKSLITNEIEPGKVHNYIFTFTYKDSGQDQSVDMGKKLSAKIQVFTANYDGNYYPYEEGTLAYNIINNSIKGLNGTTLTDTPMTEVALKYSGITTVTKLVAGEYNIKEDLEMSACGYYTSSPDNWESTIVGYGEYTQANCESRISQYLVNVCSYGSPEYNMAMGYHEPKEILSCEEIDGSYYPVVSGEKYIEQPENEEKVLTKTLDEEGTSYYYRGTVTDNYVNFAEMCWRIVRITGNGSIKLILEDKDNLCASSDGTWKIDTGYFGHKVTSDHFYIFDYLNYEGGMSDALLSFQNTELNDYLDRLIVPNWYWNDVMVDGMVYGTYYRLDSSYNGTNTVSPTLVGRRDWTEFRNGTPMYVGALTADEMVFAGAKYQYNENIIPTFSYLVDSNTSSFYSISPGVKSPNDYIFTLGGVGLKIENIYDINGSYRPVIALKPSIVIKNDDGVGTKLKPYTIE